MHGKLFSINFRCAKSQKIHYLFTILLLIDSVEKFFDRHFIHKVRHFCRLAGGAEGGIFAKLLDVHHHGGNFSASLRSIFLITGEILRTPLTAVERMAELGPNFGMSSRPGRPCY